MVTCTETCYDCSGGPARGIPTAHVDNRRASSERRPSASGSTGGASEGGQKAPIPLDPPLEGRPSHRTGCEPEDQERSTRAVGLMRLLPRDAQATARRLEAEHLLNMVAASPEAGDQSG